MLDQLSLRLELEKLQIISLKRTSKSLEELLKVIVGQILL
jgi:hypothetical protein